MSAANRFAPRTDHDVLDLVRERPLAWIVSGAGANLRASLLPVLPRHDAEGRITALIGHFARSNDHFELLQQSPHALALFLGVQGYISPSWMQDRTQAPTWNYASAQLNVEVTFFESPEEITEHLRELVDTMEDGRPARWSIDQMGPRYHSLAQRIIGFRATVSDVRGRFKLGQDERDDVFRDIAAGLERTGSAQLVESMRAFNPGRG